MGAIAEARDLLVHEGRRLHAAGHCPGASGNLSVRLDDGGMLVTPTGRSLGDLKPEEVSHLDPTGKLIDGRPPSKEAFFHRAVLDARPADRAVVHLHSRGCVAVSCLAGLDPSDMIPPLTPYFVMRVGPVREIPYAPPGDDVLYEPIREAAGSGPAMIIANHGPIISGPTLPKAVAAFEELEETAHLFLTLRSMPTRVLSAGQIDVLHTRFGRLEAK